VPGLELIIKAMQEHEMAAGVQEKACVEAFEPTLRISNLIISDLK